MLQVVIRKVALCMLGTGTLLLAVGTHSAQAQHLVTDYEAGRLTLDALTAAPPPPVRHVVYRRSVHAMPALVHRASATSTVRSRGLVHNIVYHPRATAHHATRKGHHRT
ncbi:hypothetical protein JUN65_08850 [Gluconacetobacter azotocaptans]|nr:hypothetical protein [Gluconacetobacter azotocaptans]